jgi:hypothetical protein
MNHASWLPLPSLKQVKAYLPVILEHKELCKLLEVYHNIPNKMLYASLQQRCSVLYAIKQAVDNVPNAYSAIQALGKKAEQKAKYLKKLQSLYGLGVLVNDERIFDYSKFDQYPLYQNQNSPYNLILLNTKVFYDIDSSRVWGNYPLEIADPSHRELECYVEKWSSIDERVRPPFFLWLEENSVDPLLPYRQLLPLEKYEVIIKNGKLYHGNESGVLEPLNIGEKEEAAFVIHPDKKIYTASIKKAPNGIGHLSLSHGKPLIGVGTWAVKDGVLKELNNHTGHYLTTQAQGLQTIQVLFDVGVNISPQTPYHYFIQTAPDAYTGVKSTIEEVRDQDRQSNHANDHYSVSNNKINHVENLKLRRPVSQRQEVVR